MSENENLDIVQPPEAASTGAHVSNMEQYHELYERSINDPEGFWTEHAERLRWFEKWTQLREWDYNKAEVKWFLGGKLNASVQCLDRHVAEGNGDRQLAGQQTTRRILSGTRSAKFATGHADR